jgi:hypothetical protein
MDFSLTPTPRNKNSEKILKIPSLGKPPRCLEILTSTALGVLHPQPDWAQSPFLPRGERNEALPRAAKTEKMRSSSLQR